MFNKKNKKNSSQEKNIEGPSGTPQLPELPKLPEAPNDSYQSNQLPSFPQNNIGNQLSQNTIKDAVSGEEEENDSWADEFDSPSEDDDQMMPSESLDSAPAPDFSGYNSNFSNEENNGRYQPHNLSQQGQKNEPVFVRIDKFEEGLKTFEKIKDKATEIEKMLKEVKKEKEQENKEIDNWETELESMKSKIESLNRSIFSKIE